MENLFRNDSEAWKRKNYLSLAGTSDMATPFFLNKHPGLKEIVFCLDNDPPGQDAVAGARIAENAGYFTNFDYMLEGYSLLALHRITLTDTLPETPVPYQPPTGQAVSVGKSGVDLDGEQNIRIAHKDSGGNIEKLNAEVNGSSITFETPSFSLFGVIAPIAEDAGGNDTTNDTETTPPPAGGTPPTEGNAVAAETTIPRTGDDNNIGLWVALMLSSMAALGIMIIKWRRKRA